MPGSISPATGLVQNANSTWLNGRRFGEDLAAAIGADVRMANDANCFALSEARDGAAAGAGSVFGVIIGTGCGGGIVIDGRLVDGPRGIAGEWGHTPLPWPRPDEFPGPVCWCGRNGCLETWVSGPAVAADHARIAGARLTAEAVAAAAAGGDATASATLARHADRLARGLGVVCNMLDPEVIVLGGGLSQLAHLYEALPRLVAPHLFADHVRIDIRPPRWGDASGVRGAAWLWA
jgi:fructokinase